MRILPVASSTSTSSLQTFSTQFRSERRVPLLPLGLGDGPPFFQRCSLPYWLPFSNGIGHLTRFAFSPVSLSQRSIATST